MIEGTIYLPVETVQQFMTDVFTGVGVTAEDAAIAADVLISADLRGIESHGIGRMKYYYDRFKTGQHQPHTQFEVVKETPTTAVVDARHGLGHVIAFRSMQMAIEKAKKYGLGAVAVRNSTHFGIAGYYPRMAIQQGLAGMTFTNARPAIAPTFGTMPMLGTNPIAFGAPSDEECPFLYDGATSIIQRGTVEVRARKEGSFTPGKVIDAQGNPALDPNTILKGMDKGEYALLPVGGAGDEFGGYKGYDLAVMVEIFSSAFQMGSFMYGLTGFDAEGKRQPYKLGHFFMAFQIDAFVPLEEFKHTTGNILRELRASRKEPGHDRIYTAGEKEWENEKRVRKEGISIVPNLKKEMLFLIEELNLTQYKNLF